MDFKGLVNHYLNTGVVQSNDLQENQRVLVVNLFGFIGYGLSFIIGIGALIRQEMLLATITLSFSLLLFCSHQILRSKRIINGYKYTANIFTFSLMLMMVYLVYSGGVNGTGPLWI